MYLIGITESCLKLNVEPVVNINLENYNIEETQTESEKTRVLLCISPDMNYKVWKDLKIFEAKELE